MGHAQAWCPWGRGPDSPMHRPGGPPTGRPGMALCSTCLRCPPGVPPPWPQTSAPCTRPGGRKLSQGWSSMKANKGPAGKTRHFLTPPRHQMSRLSFFRENQTQPHPSRWGSPPRACGEVTGAPANPMLASGWQVRWLPGGLKTTSCRTQEPTLAAQARALSANHPGPHRPCVLAGLSAGGSEPDGGPRVSGATAPPVGTCTQAAGTPAPCLWEVGLDSPLHDCQARPGKNCLWWSREGPCRPSV